MLPTDRRKRLRRKVVNVAIEKAVLDPAAGDFERWPDCRGDGFDESRLAAARLPGEAIDLISLDFDGNVINGAHLANNSKVAHQVVGPQVLDQQRGFHELGTHSGQPTAWIYILIHRY